MHCGFAFIFAWYREGMNAPHSRRHTFVFWFSFLVALISFLGVAGLVGLSAYIRWNLNKDFALLGGFEFEALTFSMFALALGLVVVYRPRQSSSECTCVNHECSSSSKVGQ